MKSAVLSIAAAAAVFAAGAQAQQPLAAQTDATSIPAQSVPAKDPKTAVADIQRALQSAEGVSAKGISVAVHAETVVISGDVPSEAEAARALALAQEHAGGVRVSSHVEVREPVMPPADTAATNLVREVETALRRDQRTANLGVTVSVDEKQVIGLHGLVPSRETRQAAEEVAGKVSGVQRVSSHLVIPDEPAGARR